MKLFRYNNRNFESMREYALRKSKFKRKEIYYLILRGALYYVMNFENYLELVETIPTHRWFVIGSYSNGKVLKEKKNGLL